MKNSSYSIKSFMTLLTFCVMTVSCSNEIASTASQGEPKNTKLDLKHFIEKEELGPYLTHDEIDRRLVEIGSEPFKVGMPKKDFASPNTEFIFEKYTNNMQFTEVKNRHPDVCDFTKAALFSDKIDLSTFYWRHPSLKASNLTKVDKLSYLSNDNPAFLYSFSFYEHFVRSNANRPVGFNLMNSMFHFCVIGAEPKWNYSLSRQENLRNKKLFSCHGEASPDVENTILESGSTIGFFLHQDEVYLTSLQLFDYYINFAQDQYSESSYVAIATSKIILDRREDGRVYIDSFAEICHYRGEIAEN